MGGRDGERESQEDGIGQRKARRNTGQVGRKKAMTPRSVESMEQQ